MWINLEFYVLVVIPVTSTAAIPTAQTTSTTTTKVTPPVGNDNNDGMKYQQFIVWIVGHIVVTIIVLSNMRMIN